MKNICFIFIVFYIINLLKANEINTNNNTESNKFITDENQIHNQSNSLSISLSDGQNQDLTQVLLLRLRKRKKMERVRYLQNKIILRLGINQHLLTANLSSHVNDNQKAIFSLAIKQAKGVYEMNENDVFVEKLQSFYPSCDIPNGSDPRMWESDKDIIMRLYYQLTSHLSNPQIKIDITSAKLRLFVMKINNDKCSDDKCHEIHIPSGTFKYFISFYQYLKPLVNNRKEKKLLLLTKNVQSNYTGWITFNINNSVNYWLQNPHKNFGLALEVKDRHEIKLNPNKFIASMNCSDNLVQPLPNLCEAIGSSLDPNVTSLLLNQTYPTLDLFTIEISK